MYNSVHIVLCGVQGGEKGGGSSSSSPPKESLPSPASDATTSTRSTPTTTSARGRPPGSLNKLKKQPIMPRLLPRDEQTDK